MSIASKPSRVNLPDLPKPYPTILDFLAKRFPRIPRQTWEQRILTGKVLTLKQQPITLNTPYTPHSHLLYFREVESEAKIPFKEKIIFQNEDLLVACKPHFLPSTSGGRFVRESLIHRLRETTSNQNIAPINRIDRETAGLVLFSLTPKRRGLYQSLFMHRQVSKTYYAISPHSPKNEAREWTVKNRLVPGEHKKFISREVEGEPNTHSQIQLLDTKKGRSLFKLTPITGKTHQLRQHMAKIGYTIENEKYYPVLQEETPDDYQHPLQLLSKEISFVDPISQQKHHFTSTRELDW